MQTSTIETTLRFVGEWPWWLGALAALALGGLAWVFYRRDVRALPTALGIVLPGLRASAIAMAALMLTGPVLHHREIIGELSTIRLLVDGSKSMQLTDPAMDPVRKVLMLQRMNLLPPDAIPMDLPEAADALAKAETLAQQGAESGGATIVDWKKHASDFAARIGEARERLAQAGGDATRLERFGNELYDPASQFATQDFAIAGEQRQQQSAALGRLGDITRRWRQEISAAFQKILDATEANAGSPLRGAIEKFDALGRWERVQSMLLGGEPQTFLSRLAEHHDLHLVVLHGSEAKEVWHPTSKNSTPPSALPKPAGDATDLGTPVRDGVPGGGQNQRGAIILFTDGQHNDGASPLEAAKILGGQEMPIFPIGIGSELRPPDIAIIKADVPESVFFEDRIRGELTLKDDLREGQPFTIRISDGDKVVWEQAFRSENRQARKVPFDFAVKSLVESRLGTNARGDVRVAAIPVELKIAVSHVEGDREPSNNAANVRFRAITQRRKILIVDGRPRWETRYVRNLFERDEQWEVTAVIAGTKAGDPGLPRGNNPEQFPTESALLDAYDLIVFGEVPASLWKGGELKWIADFVGQRGGALIFIDGSRGYLRGYDATPLAPLVPVQLQSGGRNESLAGMHLTELGKARASLSLAADPAQNLPLWENLPPPHTAARSAALPGAEVLLEGETRSGAKVPLIVQRPFGAGKVLYHAFDESWRWRYEAADEHHVRYWNQMATWIAEMPFAVRDKFVSLDAGAVTYRPGESAEIRVRLRDGEGKPVTNAAVDALLHREGKKMATIRLAPDENSGGLYRGKTAALAPGDYEVAIQSVAIAERDTKARTAFKVEPRATGELTLLNLNEDLLRKVAVLSGGQYLREEDIDKLTDFLTPLSQGKVIESETALWQSYWWFGPLIGLLTIEWIIRKRAGLL